MAQPTTEVPRIDVAELMRQQKSGQPVFIIDVRRGSWQDSSVKIRNAQRYEADDLLMAETVDLPIDKKALVVTYCT
ncbi:MAG TPA: hypothetical protein V6D05_07200 [Stenomitos sp.]